LKVYTKYWFLEGFNLFKKLGMKSMMELCHLLEMETYRKGAEIKLGDREVKSIFFIKKGSVKIVSTVHEQVKYVIRAGNIFGELSLYSDEETSHEVAFTLEDTVVCYINAEQMVTMMDKHDSLMNGILKIYGLRIRKLERRLQDLLYKDSKTRILEFIRDFVSEFGIKTERGFRSKKLLSHKDIGDLTNSSRQTVNNVLSELRREGMIDYNTRFISIPEKKILNNE
jgi:CRP/FNR family cyclic AMP-dependent transcriptional regulator